MERDSANSLADFEFKVSVEEDGKYFAFYGRRNSIEG
jgi:hypothetical protein